MARSPIQQQRHRDAAAACACLTVDAAAAAAYCTPECAAQISHGFLHNHCPNSRGFREGFFPNVIVDYHFLTENYVSYHMYYHSFLQCRGRLSLKVRKKRIIFEDAPV